MILEKNSTNKISAWMVISYIFFVFAALIVVVPLLYLLANSLKLPRDFLKIPPSFLPETVTFGHYQSLFTTPKTLKYFLNSLQVTTITTAFTILFGSFAAYGLARMKLSKQALGMVIFTFLFIRFYPKVTTIMPYFIIMRKLNLLDTTWAVILGHLGITIPFVTWLMLVVYNDLPYSIEEAAVVDGATPLQRFLRIVFPMTAPSVASSSILAAFMSWNEFLIASSITRRNATVLSIAVASFVSDKGIQWGPMSAMSLIMILPMLIFALAAQKYLVNGLTFGAVKG